MVESSHKVRLTKPAFANDDDGTPLPWPNRVNPLQQIVRGIGDVEKFLRRNLRGARIGIIRKLNCSAFQALAFKLLAERQTQHSQPLPQIGRASCRERVCQYV